MEDCVVYIVFQLRQAGFEVRFTWPNILYISWKHHEGTYLTKQNPIVQAMLHEANANAFTHTLPQKGGSQKKKAPLSKKDVKFNEDIEFLIRGSLQEPALLTSGNEGSPFGTAPPVAPRRSPSEYKPPESFIQTMERPGPGRQINSISGAPSASKPNNVLSDLWSL